MNLISALQILLLSANASLVLGSGIRSGGAEQERNLANPNNVGTYNCDEGCEVGTGPPVCGVDNNTYFNECLAVCQDVEIERRGACPSAPLMKMDSYIGQGKVTKEEMNAFKAEKFKLVAKRKPQFGNLPDKELVGDDNGPDGPGNGNGNGNPGNGNPGNGNPKARSKASRIVYAGDDTALEYVAEYAMEDIPEGVSYDATEGDAPEPMDEGGRLLSVLGADTRSQESYYNWPNWRLTQLDYWTGWWIFASWHGGCSGAIIGPNKVLTAAHCVYDTDNNSWMVPGRVAPGRTGSWDPYGTWGVSYATIYTTWTTSGNWEYDIAVLTIKGSGSAIGTSIGSYMGTLGMAMQPCSYTESQWRITGWPGDKSDGTIWNTGVCDDWSYSCGSRKVYHQCDTAGGMSGSAIRNGSNQIVGVHAYGSGSGSWNSGTAMNSQHLANVQYW